MELRIEKTHRSLLRNTARTLSFSFSVLPSYIKFMLSYAYLVARAMDSVVDESRSDKVIKRSFIEKIRMFFDGYDINVLDEKIKSSICNGLNQHERELVMRIDEILSYIRNTLSEYDLRCMKKLIRGVAEGMIIDLNMEEQGGCISDMKTLDKYASLIAGIPAIYWYDIYIRYNPKVFNNNFYSSAFRIGKALQYVNILRDLGHDIKKGRCYIPLTYLTDKGLNFEDLLMDSNINRIKDFIRSIIIISVDYLDESERFISSIPASEFPLRLSLIWPIYWAMDSLYLIWNRNPLRSKVRISRFKIYRALLKSPFLISDSVFSHGYRFRRETLMLSINS